MIRTRELMGCHCRALALAGPREKLRTPAHTFAWAENQYPEDRPVIPLSQSLDLSLSIEKKELDGSNTIKFKVAHKEVTSFKIDSVDLEIEVVLLDGKEIPFTVLQQAIEVKPPKALKRGEEGELKISYRCVNPKAGIYFIAPDEHYPNRPTQVWTQGQDDDARYWFPSFDEPRIKCPVELKIEVPESFIAMSNGELVNETKSGSRWKFHFKSQVPIPSYLVTLTAGNFAVVNDEWKGRPVQYLCEKGREDEAKLSFGKTPQMMDLFSKKTGVDYPYEKYAQIAVAEFIFGGMENTSATSQTDATLHPKALEEDFSSDDLVAHELGHQWFGDLVTCKSWSHGWLNEGWATFMEYIFKEKDLGTDECEYYRYEDFNIYLDEDKIYRRPVVTNFYSDPGEVWDRHIYQKGALVLHMLRAELGEDDFWGAVRNYLEQHRFGAVETVDFQRSIEDYTGRSFSYFFDQWIFRGGYPELKFTVNWNEKSKTAEVKIQQKQKVDDLTPVFKLSTLVVFVLPNQNKQVFPIEIYEKDSSFSFHLKEKPLYCGFDTSNDLLKSVEWEEPLEMAKNHLEAPGDVVGKVWVMKALAKQATRRGVGLLIDRLKSEVFWGVRAEAATALGEAKSEAALLALIDAYKTEKKSKVRTKISAALGEFRDERAADCLISALQKDTSLFVRGASASALGHTKSARAFDTLKSALKENTWNDHLATQIYAGLRNLRDDRAIPIFVDGAKYGAPKFARINAITALGDYGLNDKGITDFLKNRLDDPFHRARFAAADALARRRDPSAVGAIEEVAHRSVEGHFKAAAFRAARRLKNSLDRPTELLEFRESLDKLSEENRKLRDRLDRLEK